MNKSIKKDLFNDMYDRAEELRVKYAAIRNELKHFVENHPADTTVKILYNEYGSNPDICDILCNKELLNLRAACRQDKLTERDRDELYDNICKKLNILKTYATGLLKMYNNMVAKIVEARRQFER